MQLVDKPNSTFTTPELTRLAAYRAAVAAGFYSDWDGSATCTDTQVLALLLHADGTSDRGVYPFTREEREHLVQNDSHLPLRHSRESGNPGKQGSSGRPGPLLSRG